MALLLGVVLGTSQTIWLFPIGLWVYYVAKKGLPEETVGGMSKVETDPHGGSAGKYLALPVLVLAGCLSGALTYLVIPSSVKVSHEGAFTSEECRNRGNEIAQDAIAHLPWSTMLYSTSYSQSPGQGTVVNFRVAGFGGPNAICELFAQSSDVVVIVWPRGHFQTSTTSRRCTGSRDN
jgi:hypothetical protein